MFPCSQLLVEISASFAVWLKGRSGFFLLTLAFALFHFPGAEDPAQAQSGSIRCENLGNGFRCTMQVSGSDDPIAGVIWTGIWGEVFPRGNWLRVFPSQRECGNNFSISGKALATDGSGYRVIATASTTHRYVCGGATSDGSPGSLAAGDAGPGASPAQVAYEVKVETPQAAWRRVDAAGVGVKALVDAGFLGAVDVWGPQGAQGEVCFAESGSLLLLDAATSPRAQVALETYRRDGKTCARIDRPGTVVLMPGASNRTGAPSTAALPTDSQGVPLIADSLEDMILLSDCEVTARYNLNFREKPAGSIVGLFPAGTTSEASARTPNWFRVSHQRKEGWISEYYVTTSGDCGQGDQE